MQAVGRNMVLRVRFDFPENGQFQILDWLAEDSGGTHVKFE